MDLDRFSQILKMNIFFKLMCKKIYESILTRLILTSTGDDFTLNAGNTIGLATPINQSNFSEVLIQAFQHEIDVNDFLIDPFVKVIQLINLKLFIRVSSSSGYP